MDELWQVYLYQPLFNLLIFIYNNYTGLNMGWAIVILTVMLRVILLPFTLVNERNRVRNEVLVEEIKEVNEVYKKDHIMRKEAIRKILKRRKVQPWSRVVVLGIQALVILLLYQVFVGGLTGERLIYNLYLSVDFPGAINTIFYGTDLKNTRDIIWPGIVALFLFAEVYIGLKKRTTSLTQADLAYFILFPTAVFVFLWILPVSKALFVFTSLLFSLIVSVAITPIFREKKKEKL